MNVLDDLDALRALAETGTMTAAAAQLRLTQSAVSKRIAALEAETGLEVVERDGRGVRLTEDGRGLLERASPLVAELRAALGAERTERRGVLVVGVSESILASWGAQFLRHAADAVDGLDLRVNAHRSPVAIEHVRAGEYQLALVAGESDAAPDLTTELLLEEEMVVVPSGGGARKLRGAERIDVLSIEPGAATWRSLRRRLGHLRRAGGLDLRPVATVQSYAALVQMARSGFGHGLAPLGIVEALGVPRGAILRLPKPGLTRPVSIVARRTTFSRPLVAALREALASAASLAGTRTRRHLRRE